MIMLAMVVIMMMSTQRLKERDGDQMKQGHQMLQY